MVFPGKRSNGCYLCRRRKVKCDGAKPECQRCVSRGAQCPGYPDGFVFREYRKDRHESRMTIVDPASTTSSSLFTHRSSSPTPRSKLSLCLDWQSICYFAHHYVFYVHKSPCRGRLAFFPDLYREKGNEENSYLKHAILSAASMALFNTARVGQLYVNARRHYGSAMRFLSRALEDCEVVGSDEVFAAVLFLGVFTDLSGETENNGLNPHIPGSYSLLHLRDRMQLQTKYGRELFGWAIIQVQTQALARGQFHYATLPPSICTLYKPDTIYRAGIVTDMISQLCRSISETRSSVEAGSLRNGRNTDRHLIRRILIRARYIIGEIDTWHDTVPQHWKEQYQDHDKSRDEWTTTFLSTIHSAQVTFYTHLLEFLDHLSFMDTSTPTSSSSSSSHNTTANTINHNHNHNPPPPSPINRTDLTNRLQTLLRMICSTVTSSLGHLDETGTFQPSSNAKLGTGYVLRVPMRVVVGCQFASEGQVGLCVDGLGFLGFMGRG